VKIERTTKQRTPSRVARGSLFTFVSSGLESNTVKLILCFESAPKGSGENAHDSTQTLLG